MSTKLFTKVQNSSVINTEWQRLLKIKAISSHYIIIDKKY